MYDISELPYFIVLGNQGDFGQSIVFDVSAWSDLLPDRYEITYMRPGETAVNPAVQRTFDAVAETLTWIIDAAVTELNGLGSIVIEAYKGQEMLHHSDRKLTVVGEGHGAVGAAPTPVASWLENATAALADIQGITFAINNGNLEVTI